MSLYQRHKVWYYLFYVNGKRYRGSTKTENRKEAQRIEARARVAAERGESLTPPKPPLLRDFAPRFLEFVKESRLEAQSKRDYGNGWRLISRSKLAGMRLHEITTDDVATTHFHDSPYSTNSALRTLRRMLHKAKDWKIIQDVPIVKLAKAKARDMLFTPEVEAKLLSKCPRPLSDLLVIMLDTGMRDGEVVRMRWENVYLNENFYFNPKGKTKQARRPVPLSQRVLQLLKDRQPALQGWVFGSDKSKSGHIQLHKLQLRFRKICRELGLSEELKLYSARHTFGTVTMKETKNPALVMQAMGHSDLKTTLIYLHPEVAEVKSVIDRRNEQKYVM
jgi:integrase